MAMRSRRKVFKYKTRIVSTLLRSYVVRPLTPTEKIMKNGEIARETDRKRERDRQTERQRQRETEGDRDRQRTRDRQRQTETDRKIQETDRKRERQICWGMALV